MSVYSVLTLHLPMTSQHPLGDVTACAAQSTCAARGTGARVAAAPNGRRSQLRSVPGDSDIRCSVQGHVSPSLDTSR